jgi:hypothetical protein
MQNGEDDEGLMGFLPEDIEKELKRVAHLVCVLSFRQPCPCDSHCFEFVSFVAMYILRENGSLCWLQLEEMQDTFSLPLWSEKYGPV